MTALVLVVFTIVVSGLSVMVVYQTKLFLLSFPRLFRKKNTQTPADSLGSVVDTPYFNTLIRCPNPECSTPNKMWKMFDEGTMRLRSLCPTCLSDAVKLDRQGNIVPIRGVETSSIITGGSGGYSGGQGGAVKLTTDTDAPAWCRGGSCGQGVGGGITVVFAEK